MATLLPLLAAYLPAVPTALPAVVADMLATGPTPAPQPVAPAATGVSLILTVLITLAGGGTLAAIATALFNRSKTKAEARHVDAQTGRETAAVEGEQASAAAVLTGSALTLLGPMREEIHRLGEHVQRQDEAIAALERKIEESQRRERGHVRQLARYRDWIEVASQALSDAGIPIDPPPHDAYPYPPLPN